MDMDREPIDTFTRVTGWIVTCFTFTGYFGLLAILEKFDMPNIVFGILATVLGGAGWLLLLILNDRFDLMGDRKKK